LNHNNGAPLGDRHAREEADPGESFCVADDEQVGCSGEARNRLADWSSNDDLLANANVRQRVLPPIRARLKSHFDHATKWVNRSDRGDPSQPKASGFRPNKVQRVPGTQMRDEVWGAELKR
jgi:hypothetical protein